MVKCPKCGAEIDHLEYNETKDYSGSAELVDGRLNTDIRWSDSEMSFDCPECDEEVATDEDTAMSILKGEYDGQTQPSTQTSSDCRH